MTRFSSLRVRLVGTVFLAIAPAGVVLYFADKYYTAAHGSPLPWTRLTLGLLALGAAWSLGTLLAGGLYQAAGRGRVEQPHRPFGGRRRAGRAGWGF